MGKSALLDELRALTRDFAVLKADGLELERTPFGALAQWNVDPPRAPDGAEPSPLVAAQAVRERLDLVAARRPVLLQLDDLHWVGPESVDALLWLCAGQMATGCWPLSAAARLVRPSTGAGSAGSGAAGRSSTSRCPG